MASSLQIVQKRFPQVIKVIDARKDMKIEVQNRDVSKAARMDKIGCAMAVACKRKCKLDGVIIARQTAYMIRGKRAIRFRVPEGVTREIISYDRGAAFETGNYQLCHIPKASRLGRNNRPMGSRTVTGKKAVRHVTENVRAVLGSKEDK